jgi:hypothetical protein
MTMNIKYKTATVLAGLAKFYSRKNVQLLAGSSPKTNGSTIWVPTLPAELTLKQLRTLRCYIDHEAAHIRMGSFKSFRKQRPDGRGMPSLTAMVHMEQHFPGSVGKMVLNALEDARIEQQMADEFDGVDFTEMHADFCEEDLGEPTEMRALIHMLYLNSRLGWGHHPACEYWEGVLDSVKREIMKAHKAGCVRDIYDIAIKVMEALASAPPPPEPEEEDEGDGEGEGADVNETSESESGEGEGDESDSDTDDESGDGGNSDTDDESGDDGDSDSDGEGEGEDGNESDGESGNSTGEANESSGEGGESNATGDSEGDATETGSGGGGPSSPTKPSSLHESLEQRNPDDSASESTGSGAMADSLKPSDGEETMSPEAYSDAGGTAKHQDYVDEPDPNWAANSPYAKGSLKGSMLGRLIKAKIISHQNTGHTPPRYSGSNVHRGNLAKFASGMTGRVLTRNIEEEDVSADVVLCLDISGSIGYAAYEGLFNTAGCIDRALTMGGASVGVIFFGENIVTAKPLSTKPARSLRHPAQEGNTDTGNAMITASEMLAAGSGNRKICVVLTDGHPGAVTDEFHGSPCDAGMRRLYELGSELICIPFDTTKAALDNARRKIHRETETRNNTPENREAYARYLAPINNFIKYMVDHGVYVSDIERSPRTIAKQIMEFRGDLRRYLGKSLDL